MKLRIATWNINSIRLRVPLIYQFTKRFRPDILCLQEIKCTEEQFPFAEMHDLGFKHIIVNGQKAYHGVATLSRHPITPADKRDFNASGHARHLAVSVTGKDPVSEPITIHNFYVPSGGDEPNPDINPKFRQKLDYLQGMQAWLKDLKRKTKSRMILLGDLNIAPLENDVWSHKQLLRVVSHTPIEVEHLDRVQKAHNWVDAVRAAVPPEEKLFTWWSYRARDWRTSNRGRRLDHIWVTPALSGTITNTEIAEDARGWGSPSDHVPVIADLKI